MKHLIASFALLITSFLAVAETMTPEDPWEGFNRSIFSFNETVDEYGLKPLAQGYDAITPNFMQKGVSNFFSNLGEIPNTFNNLLQGKWDETASSTSRFLINTTIGLLGLFDVASAMGIEQYNEDFGQTLGYWGVGSGPYLVLPFFGPSTARDASGMVVDYSIYDGMDLYDFNSDEKWIGRGLNAIQTRAKYLSAERMIFGDRYSFLRDVYIQTREGEVKDISSTRDSSALTTPMPAASEGMQDSWGSEGDSWGETDSWGEEL
ncbi:MlaA family lipoprotein [Marinomonas fungiae]|uniref:ABC-type transporter Mla maintaining outer membrane lipid asymmetry, lipoprotein component MlaA n=1 Tax=Marinomonas fungiae TaxID=1137284 RepID=A0A0K6ILQ2_9GAMM|nr:VacJ family lipoprotein [Marinomonas fungiae]CUB04021.1 ABC-type transporter Mla maintaining outer membrane lipid asymmetry, lipoprotein component MlaA [Marinomonas fungiae]